MSKIRKVIYQNDFLNTVGSSRADKYQYLIREIPWDDTALSWFQNQDGINGKLSPFQYNENILELKDKLVKRVYRLARSVCTDRQFSILQMMVDGYTQVEMAEKLGLGQSTITKTIHGTQIYDQNGIATIRHGGFMKKIKKAVQEDSEVRNILDDINELQKEIL